MLPDPGPPRQQRWFGRRAVAPPCVPARPVHARAPRPLHARAPRPVRAGLRGPAGSGLSGLSA